MILCRRICDSPWNVPGSLRNHLHDISDQRLTVMLARFMGSLSNTQDSYDEYKLIAFARRPSHIYSQCFRNSLPPIPQYKPPRTRKPTRESEPGPPISLPKQNQASKNTSFGRGLADRNQHLNQVQCNLQVCFRWNRLLMLMCARLNYTLDSAHELSAAICSYANSWPWLATRPALCYEAAVGACARETHHRLQKSFEKGGEPPATASGSCIAANCRR